LSTNGLANRTTEAGARAYDNQRGDDCHPRSMPVDQDKLEGSFRKLRKSLRNIPKQPSPEEVHDLRTRARRLESTLHALMLDQERDGRRLIKTVSPIRKKAGQVRDMDVLTGFAATLANDSQECLTQLLEHLGAKRVQSARRLRATVVQKRKKARRRLRQYSGIIRRNASRKSTSNDRGWPADATAIAIQLSSELAAWPRLNSSNLHPYRLKVKELRYVLQLAEGQDSEFVDALGEVKDAIGEWHDWSELGAVANEILDHGSGCKVLKQIRDTTTAKFDHALSLAEALRKKFLGSSSDRNAGRRSAPVKLKEPVLITAARLVG
jgi:CHAD domain-containing protein